MDTCCDGMFVVMVCMFVVMECMVVMVFLYVVMECMVVMVCMYVVKVCIYTCTHIHVCGMIGLHLGCIEFQC